MLIEMLLTGVVVPAAISLVAVLLLWRGVLHVPGRRPHWVPALALAVSFITGWTLTKGAPRWPVPDSAGWLPILAIGGLVVGTFVAWQRINTATTSFLRLLVSFAAVWATTQSLQSHTWEGQAWLWVAGLGILLFAIWSLWESLLVRHDGPLAPALLLVLFSALAVGSLLGKTATISQSTGIICASLGGMFLAAFFRRHLDLSRATLFVAMPLFAGLLVNAYFYAEFGTIAAVLLLLITPAALLGVKLAGSRPLLYRLVIAAAVTAIPFIISLGLHFIQQDQPSSSDGSDDYYDDYYGI